MASTPLPGILYVTVQPKETLPLAQLHDWYNNEHGHLLVRCPNFVNGLRYQAADLESSGDTSKPEWLATYDVADMNSLSEAFFQPLTLDASPREEAVASELEVRRNLFDLVSTRQKEGFVPTEETDLSDLDYSEGKGRVLVAVGMSLTPLKEAEREVGQWYETEHIPLLMKIPGWLRTRRFKTSSRFHETPIEYIALHEYENINGLGGPEHQAAMNTPWRTIIREKYIASNWKRTWNTYYIFGPAPRDLSTLSQLSPKSIATGLEKIPKPCWENPEKETRTWNGTFQPAIESFVTTEDEIRIPYRLEGSSKPSAPTILFSNSLLTDWSIWNPFLSTPYGKSLLKKYRILRYNTRGRDKLPSTSKPITLNTVTDDISTLLNHLRIKELDTIIGVSLGGITTLNFSLAYPEKVKKFIACDFNIASSNSNMQAWESRVKLAKEAGMGKLAGITVDRWFASEERKGEVRKVVEGNSVEGFEMGVKALFDYDLRRGVRLIECGVPGLLVVGEGDGALWGVMDGFKGEIGEGVELRVVEGAGHLPMVERPEAFVNVVKGFLG